MALAYYRNMIKITSTQISEELSPEDINYMVNEEGENSEKALKFLAMSQSSSVSSPSSTISSGNKSNLHLEESHSVINFKNGYNNFVHGGGASGSFLNFEQNDQSPPSFSPKMSHQDEYPFWEDLNCVQSSNNSYGYINNTTESPQQEEVPLEWKSSGTNEANKKFQARELASNKRPLMEKSTQALKKQCSASETKKQPKSKSTASKDPQSVAAKNRRERISERLKVLQELVPNGTKVDLVTMLEKAIGYVKFLQLQVKVLAADEFWPAQGGRAPDLAQVKEALDAILSTQRDRNSSSK